MKHKDNNLNLLRILAAFFVLYEHSFALTGTPNSTSFLGTGFGAIGVAIFFVISGYLVTASYLSSNSVLRFAWHRTLRIFPALIMVTFVSIFIFGPFLTSYKLVDYFSNPGTWSYLWNIGLFPVFALPGVLESAPVANALNGSLWTLPLEVALYLTIVFLGLISSLNRPAFFLFLLGYICLFSFAKSSTDPWVMYGTDWRLFVMYGIYFYAGAAFKVFEFKKGGVSGVAAASLVLCVLVNSSPLWLEFVKVLATTYIVLSFGLASSLLGSWINRLGDYSYGLYIYAFPIQQIAFSELPWMGMPAYIVLCSVITLVCAYMSWHLIESKALSLKDIWDFKMSHKRKLNATLSLPGNTL